MDRIGFVMHVNSMPGPRERSLDPRKAETPQAQAERERFKKYYHIYCNILNIL